jgi:hypothetical protein
MTVCGSPTTYGCQMGSQKDVSGGHVRLPSGDGVVSLPRAGGERCCPYVEQARCHPHRRQLAWFGALVGVASMVASFAGVPRQRAAEGLSLHERLRRRIPRAGRSPVHRCA